MGFGSNDGFSKGIANGITVRPNFSDYKLGESRTDRKWIDGAPIYKGSFSFSKTSSWNSNTWITVLNNAADWNIKLFVAPSEIVVLTGGDNYFPDGFASVYVRLTPRKEIQFAHSINTNSAFMKTAIGTVYYTKS